MIFLLISQDCLDIFFICVSQDAIFTTFATIFIFFIGYLINRWIRFSKEKKRLNEVENYFYLLFDQIKFPINDQIKILNKLAEDIANKNFTQFTYKENVNLDVTNLLNIPHVDLYKIFIVRKKGEIAKKAEHFTNMSNTLNYIRILKINAKNNMDKFFNEFRHNEGNWMEAYNSILEHFDTFVSSNIRNSPKKVNDGFLNDFNMLLEEWKKYEDTNNIHLEYKNFIIPLRSICNRYRGDERANVIVQLINKAESAFKSIGYYRETYSKQFKVDASYLKSKFEAFESAEKYFRGENGKN